jgi:hypothetical protein
MSDLAATLWIVAVLIAVVVIAALAARSIYEA